MIHRAHKPPTGRVREGTVVCRLVSSCKRSVLLAVQLCHTLSIMNPLSRPEWDLICTTGKSLSFLEYLRCLLLSTLGEWLNCVFQVLVYPTIPVGLDFIHGFVTYILLHEDSPHPSFYVLAASRSVVSSYSEYWLDLFPGPQNIIRNLHQPEFLMGKIVSLRMSL